MSWMNQWEVEENIFVFKDDPVLEPLAVTLFNLVEWTNYNSDGWAYWPKPARSAKALMELLNRHKAFNLDPPTVAEAKATLRAIKAFRTRQGADFVIVEP